MFVHIPHCLIAPSPGMVSQRFPFDWKNPIGYYIAVSLQYFGAKMALSYVGCFLSFGVASFAFSIAVCRDLKYELNLIDGNVKIGKRRCQIFSKFMKFIDLHTNMKQLSIGQQHEKNRSF